MGSYDFLLDSFGENLSHPPGTGDLIHDLSACPNCRKIDGPNNRSMLYPGVAKPGFQVHHGDFSDTLRVGHITPPTILLIDSQQSFPAICEGLGPPAKASLTSASISVKVSPGTT